MKNRLKFALRRLRRGPMIKYSSPIEVERNEWHFYLSLLQEGMTVFDVGSNVGELTLVFSRFIQDSGCVHAFEASKETFERMQMMVQVAGRKNVVLNQMALSDREGEVELYVYGKEFSSLNSLANRPLHKYGSDLKPVRKEKVQATTIDRYCVQNNITSIDLLKVDVEGAEYQVLLGTHQMLAEKRVRCCILEFGQTTFDMGNSPDAIEAYLHDVGYDLRNLVDRDPIFPGRASAETAQFSMHLATPRS